MDISEHRRTLERLRREALAQQEAYDRKREQACGDYFGEYAEKIDDALAALDDANAVAL